MNLIELRNQLSIRTKNGIPFLMSATMIWIVITIIFLQDFGILSKNILMLYSTGLMPFAIIIAKLIKADWNTNDHPLGKLGLYLNLAQLMYFPLLVWAYVNSPISMMMFFAIITGAHFFPYGWLYHTKAYYFMAPIISIGATILGFTLELSNLWMIPAFMTGALIVLIIWLYLDYKKKDKEGEEA